MIHGGMGDKHNAQAVQDLRDGKVKYLVNVGMAAVGLSVNHIDIVAFLRLTESSRFYTQVLGRGMRLDPDKKDFWVLDYTANVENLFPSGNLFAPEITAYGDKPKIKADFTCPQCSSTNTFTLRPNPDGMAYDDQGYFLKISGERYQPLTPAHYGRRCTYVEAKGRNVFERCSHFWECKICDCGQDNDIAARKCSACKALLIDYNDKLVGGFLDFKNDLSQVQTDAIEWFSKKTMSSKQSNPMLRVVFNTKFRQFVAFFSTRVNRRFYELMSDPSFKPKTVSYKKSTKTEFFTVVDFDRNEDVAE